MGTDIGDALELDGYGTGAAITSFAGDRTNNWIRILPKTIYGAPARGAIVELVQEDKNVNQIRTIDPGSGYLCQQEPVAHFGIGSSSAISEIAITWVDGATKTLTSPEINNMIVVEHPATENS